MKQGKAVIENIGKSVSETTVLYVQGTSSEIADTRFTIRLTEGKHLYYTTDLIGKLKGKTVNFTYLSTNDVRVPRGIVFKSIED